MTDSAVSQQQLTVICALSNGATTTAAAQEAGVHRNTINNWRRSHLAFQHAFAHAQYDRALCFREKIEALVDFAIQSLHQILTDPKTSPSVRLKAALAVLNTASTPPEPKKQIELDIEKITLKRTPAQSVTEEQLKPPPPVHNPAQANPATESPVVHNPAQTNPVTEPPVVHNPAQANPVTEPPIVHNPAQAPLHSETPKIGRNQPCPCRSGRKFKHCCLNNPAQCGSQPAAS